jgi:hypothetical protein
MTAVPITRRSKALTIVPLAVICGAWSVSLVSFSSAGAAPDHNKSLPDGTSVPTSAIEAPASVPIPGVIAPGVPAGSADSVVSGASTSGIPAPALAAYQRAAQIIDTADKSCNIPWELIGAIGRVESDHGRYGGNTLTAKGISTPGIYGPELNGKNNTQAIMDTDGGLLDHDSTYDRAVGPMQFIPSTWQVVKVDADGDGVRNPQDINDASLATAVYLCSGEDNLGTRKGQEAATYRYNHSHDYVNLVLRIAEAYTAGDYTSVPSGSYAGTLFTPSSSSAIKHRKTDARIRMSHGGAKTSTPAGTSTAPSGGVATGSHSGATGGTDTSTPSAAPTNDPLKAVTDGVKGLTSALPSPVQSALAPLTDNLSTLTQALNFCLGQFAAIPDPLGLLGPLKGQCASAVKGKTTDQAASLIPNTLKGIIGWLS